MSIIDDFIGALELGQRSGAMTIEKTMDLILAKARRHTAAEAGSIFIVRPNADEPAELKACSLQNDRIQMNQETFSVPINKTSIAGYVAVTGEVVEVDDLYEISPNMPYSFNRSFDDRAGYRSKSMLAFPLKNYQGQVIGVVQLLNHINGVDELGTPTYEPFPFTFVDDMKSLISVLGAMVERTDLLFEIKKLRKEVEALRGIKA
ncbi:MAG: hypothetical protein CMF61_01000 [Magnetococcales bacterium]|nr:hypothetical protein [Magnetococcales bacterium]PPR19219.1 MAG: hypothetical protein CFH43_00308 [Pseudomonadota bacterium]